jgi:serine phosphatase RsbU (regulator of sigma subunit)/anti-sigma regulatory factor (Ser/Thr protein kinase)/anti-anti-sigma regulatory factor
VSTNGAFGSAEAVLAAFEQSDAVIAVVEGPELRLVALSARARAALGDRQTLGRPLRDAFPDAEAAQTVELVAQVHRTHEPFTGHDWHVPSPGSGTDRVFDVGFVPWRDEDGSVRGVIGVGFDVTPRPREDTPLRSDGDDTVTTMQDALLPDELPVVPGLDIAAGYLIAADEADAGGDWFDAVVRPDGRVAIAVGDVVGHGVDASAVMGQLRAVLHERLTSGAPLPAVLGDLDRYARTRPESHATTVAVAEVDPRTGAFEYCTAGHPPPLVIRRGEAMYLATSDAAPLATGSGRFPLRSGRVEEGDLLVLYTDGLVERPGRTMGQNTVELAQAMESSYRARPPAETPRERTSERVCRQGLELLTGLSGHSDDITLLAAHRVPEVAPLELHLPAEKAAVGIVRRELDRWFDLLDVRPLDRFSVQHAVGELVTNSVEHAYADSPDPGFVDVDVAGRIDGLVARVRDTGQWLAHARPLDGRGNGLAMARGLVDAVSIDIHEHGTTVTACHQLTRPARLLRARHPERAVPPMSDAPFSTRRVADDVLAVSGPLDWSCADELRARIRRATSGGTQPVVLDLGAVTHLASAGVQVLHDVVDEGAAMTLLAPVGSVAQHVLELVRIPYRSER